MTLSAVTTQTYIANSQTTIHPDAWGAAHTSFVSPSFTPPANSRLLALVTGNRPSAGDYGLSGTALSDSAGLTWVRNGFKSLNAGSVGGAGSTGTTAELWSAALGSSPSAMTTSVLFPAAANASNWELGGILATITDSSGGVPIIGNVAASASASGTPTGSITTSAGSLVIVVISDWATVAGTAAYSSTGGNTAMTPLNSSTGANKDLDSNYAYHYAVTTSVTSAGTTTVTATGPAAENYNMLLVEIKPPLAAAPNPPIVGQQQLWVPRTRAASY